MSKLDLIREALKPFGKTFYGKANPKDGDEWNYYVFRRKRVKKKASTSTDYKRFYEVAIVKEDYIPENHEFEIINAIEKETKLKLADDDIVIDYTFKGSTDFVVEVAVITFAETIKGCEA